MPDRGVLDIGSLTAHRIGGTRPAPWTLANARWAQVTYEVDQQVALAHMPADVSRPVPCYARLLVLDAPESPAGPFRLAMLSTGGRFRLLGRNVLVDGMVDGDAKALAEAFGSPFRPGRVSMAREGQTWLATVSDAEHELATLGLPALRAVDPAMLRWDSWLGFADGDDGRVRLVEYTPQVEPTAAFLSKGAQLEIPGTLPRDHHWRAFRNLNTISACYEEGTFSLPAPEVQSVI